MSQADQYERYMLDLINAERAKVGAPPLQLEQNLNDAADAHSSWMLREDTFSHTGVNGSSPTDRVRSANFDLSGGWRTAENIAVQSERGAEGIMDDVANLHTSLMNSDGHRANILNPDLDYIGIGIELGDYDYGSGEWESVIVTQNFASTGGSVDLDLGSASEAPPPSPDLVTQTPVAVVVTPDPEPEVETAAPAPTPTVQQGTDVPQTTPAPSETADDVPSVITAFDGFGIDLSGLIGGDTAITNVDIDIADFAAAPSSAGAASQLIDIAKDHYVDILARFAEELAVQPQLDDLAV